MPMPKHQPGRFFRAVAPLDGGAHAGVIPIERCSLVSDYIKNVTIRRLDPRVGEPLAMVMEKTMHQGEPVGLRRRRDEVGDAVASVEHCLIGKLVAAAMSPGYRHDADQCAPRSALTLIIPENNDPVIAVVASTPRER